MELCPTCQSNKYRKEVAKGVALAYNRRCQACNTVWQPACSKGLATLFILGALAGWGYIAFAVIDWSVNTGRDRLPTPIGIIDLLVIIGGILLFRYGLGVLRGKCGALTIVETGTK